MPKCAPDLELLDELIQQMDFSFVQEGGDLGRRNTFGYHFTSKQGYAKIKRDGLGAVPGWIETHEVEYWLAMPFLAPDVAACLYMEWHAHPGRYGNLSREQLAVQHEVVKQLADVRGLRVAWFYRDLDIGGATASHSDRCVRFDLHVVGDWLAHHADSPHEFTDNADGYAIAWIGPAIPTSLLSPC